MKKLKLYLKTVQKVCIRSLEYIYRDVLEKIKEVDRFLKVKNLHKKENVTIYIVKIPHQTLTSQS